MNQDGKVFGKILNTMYLAVKPTGAINSFNLFVDAKREKGKEIQIVFGDTYAMSGYWFK